MKLYSIASLRSVILIFIHRIYAKLQEITPSRKTVYLQQCGILKQPTDHLNPFNVSFLTLLLMSLFCNASALFRSMNRYTYSSASAPHQTTPIAKKMCPAGSAYEGHPLRKIPDNYEKIVIAMECDLPRTRTASKSLVRWISCWANAKSISSKS